VPITNIEGQGISVFMGGSVTGTATIDGNVIVANQSLGAGIHGLAVQVDDGPAGGGASTADYNFIVTNNQVSAYEGNGIRAIARASLGKMDVTIQGNQLGTPSMTDRNAIRVDSGSSAGDVTTCLKMSGNSAMGGGNLTGSGGYAGIGLRKQGTVATTNEFGLDGISFANPTNAQVQAYVGTNNPSNDGTSSANGVDILSGSAFVSCTTSP
jgi:hypothetical protein